MSPERSADPRNTSPARRGRVFNTPCASHKRPESTDRPRPSVIRAEQRGTFAPGAWAKPPETEREKRPLDVTCTDSVRLNNGSIGGLGARMGQGPDVARLRGVVHARS